MSQEPTKWIPPQEKNVKLFFNTVGIGALVVGGALLVKAFVPTVTDALILLQKLLANGISTALTAGGLAATLWVLYETFSSKGKINGLFAQAYSSFIHTMTMELLNVDPMSPLKDSLAAVKAKKKYYDENFAQFDGQVSIFKASREEFTKKATLSERRAKAAKGLIQSATDAASRAQAEKDFNRESYSAGSAQETAAAFDQMINRLSVVRNVIVRLQEASGDLIYKLEIDIEATEVQWNAANSMSKMERAARGILENNGKDALAQQAQQLVQNKYASAIGRLENLNDAAMPLLNSLDLDKATFSQQYLDKWEEEERMALAPPIDTTVRVGQAVPVTGKFAGMINRE